VPGRGGVAGGRWRNLAVATLSGAAVWAIAAHALTARERDALTERVVGDEAALRRALRTTPHGLAIRLDARQRATLHRVLATDPLNGDAIALAAMDRAARGDGARAAALERQAIRVEPRTRLAWLARLQREMGHGAAIAATDSALRLLAIDPRRYASYLPVLAILARDRATTAAIARVLERRPIWRTPFLRLLATDRIDSAIRYALVTPATARATANAPTGADDAGFVNDLANGGDIERAYLAWLSLLPDAALSHGGIPYDGGFDGLPGPPPFNWQLTPSDTDHAALTAGTLEISYAGRQQAVLASQIVLPRANARYRIASVLAAADRPTPDGGTLVWQLSCLPERIPLAELPLDRSRLGMQRGAPFVVPAQGCNAAVLALVGRPNDMPARLTARIQSVALARIEATLAARR
jgi:hypothetical protein